jgi:hypothetical protein
MAFTKGDIIWVNAARRHPDMLRHPAVVWDDEIGDDADFHGIMLTHSEPNGRYDNILMTANHFEAGQEIVFNNTHFVNQLFIKFQGWGPFHKGGVLTPTGIEFIETMLTNTNSMSYDEYVANNRR